MPKSLKVTFVIFGLFILGLFGAGYLFISDTGMCKNIPVAESVSPDMKLKLVLFERNCGATTGFSSQISLLKNTEVLKNKGGNVYIAEGYPEGYSFNWQSNTQATIIGIKGENYKKESSLNGIQFIYR